MDAEELGVPAPKETQEGQADRINIVKKLVHEGKTAEATRLFVEFVSQAELAPVSIEKLKKLLKLNQQEE